MSTYNVGIKISTSFANSNATTAASGTHYTVPANGYALFNSCCSLLIMTAGYSCIQYVAGLMINKMYIGSTAGYGSSSSGGEFYNNATAAQATSVINAVAGPSQAITFSKTSSGYAESSASGVVFANTV